MSQSNQDTCRHVFVKKGDREVCEKCGVQAVDSRAVAKHQLEDAQLTLEDHILMLIYLLPNHTSVSHTKMMKEVFLVEREGPKLQAKIPRAGFVPHKYGPWSKNVDDAMDRLRSRGEVVRLRDEDTSAKEIRLSPDGVSRAESLLASLDPRTLSDLGRFLREIDTFDQNALLRYVYLKYPTYAEKSEIRKKVLKGTG